MCAARPARALARARRHRARDAEHRPRHRHHRLPGARLLQPRQRALDPGRAGDLTRRFADPERARDLGRAADQDLGLHQRLRPPPRRPHRHPRRREERRGVLPDHRSAVAPTSKPSSARCSGRPCPMREVADVIEDIVAAYLELRARPERDLPRHLQAHRRRAVQGARLCRSLRDGYVSKTASCASSTTRRLPESGAVIVPAARYLADRAELASRRARRLASCGPTTGTSRNSPPHLDSLALVALVFPNFRDGRAYSQARLLRERYGFRGELRATGRGAARPIPVSAARRLRLPSR